MLHPPQLPSGSHRPHPLASAATRIPAVAPANSVNSGFIAARQALPSPSARSVARAMSYPGRPMNGAVLDLGTATINPAALTGSHAAPSSNVPPQPSPRGVKRSRSPDTSDQQAGDRDDDAKRRKAARSSVTTRISESPRPSMQSIAPPVQTPQSASHNTAQTQASPPAKTTPTKPAVLKALPTVRDHTTDVLNNEQDEFLPREFDSAGEAKITQNGHLLDGRQYKCRTFRVPGRGDKLFMLATECARVLNYRDSYLLFNKNRSLYKIIANQTEKDDLIQQEILPYSYRSRQIAIVTARSMFRQFGSRVVVNGRRVRDDYWESKARKQGFTEEDAAGEKRPGAAKAREAAAAASNANAIATLQHGEIIYSNGPNLDGYPGLLTPGVPQSLPMIADDMRQRDYSSVQRPRHEPSGAAYVDMIKPTGTAELITQASHASDYNKSMRQQGESRREWLDEQWRRPHDPPPVSEDPAESATVATTSQTLQSPPVAVSSLPQPGMSSLPQPNPAHMMTPQHSYTQAPHAQNPMAQSPIQNMHAAQNRLQQHRSSPSLTQNPPTPQQATYGYPQNQMWPPPQPQPSPLSHSHSNLQQYGQQPGALPQQSPHAMPQPSPMHQPPQLHHASSTGSLHGTQMMGYQGMAGMPGAGYPGMAGRPQNPYQPSPSPQQYMQQSAAQQHPGMQGWAPGPTQPSWQGYQ